MEKYKNKYIKYKNKYLKYKKKNIKNKMNGGDNSIRIEPELWKNIIIDEKNLITLHNNSLFKLIIPSNRNIENYHIFNKKIKNLNKISNQKQSGRCWMFAGLNIIRNKFIEKYNLEGNFEFSQSYLFFWDKFERMNYIIHLLEDLYKKGERYNSRIIENIILNFIDDGGTWSMFQNLIKKYGLMPKCVFPETYHTSNSDNINTILKKKLKEYLRDIYNEKMDKTKALEDIYLLLVKFFGKPPNEFDWEYIDKKKKYKIIKNLTVEKFTKMIKIDLCDYICLLNDPRNELYNHFLEFAEKIKPKFILIENVIGIKNKAKDIISKLDKINYYADFRVIQASEYGIPQNRKRVFFFAAKKSNQSKEIVEKFFFNLENAKRFTQKTVIKDALFNLRKLTPKKIKNDRLNEYYESGFNIEKKLNSLTNKYISLINQNTKSNYVFNHKARYNNLRDIEIFSKLPQGGDSTHKNIRNIMPYKNRSTIFKDKYFKLQNDKISKTITSHMKFDCNMYIHPTQSRGLTPREAARIQSFSDNYFFEGTLGQCYSQIGNAVPPLLSKYLCKSIEKIND